jgi:hypothetical protein
MAISYRKGNCCKCESFKEVLIVKRLPHGNYCSRHNTERLRQQKRERIEQSELGGLPSKKDADSESSLFKAIWASRTRVSFVSGEPLGNTLRTLFMAHVIPKRERAYPKFKLYDKNIVLLTWDEHNMWDNWDREKLKKKPEWDKMFELEAELLKEYEEAYG